MKCFHGSFFSMMFLFLLAIPALGESDPILQKLMSRLPKGWSMVRDNNNLTIQRLTDCWVIFVNRLNAAPSQEKDAARLDRIMKSGDKRKAKLVFTLDPRWSAEKIAAVQKENADLYLQLEKLPETFSVKHLLNLQLSRKGGEFFTSSTPAETKQVAKYQAEKARLAGLLKTIPEFHSRDFTLFLTSKEGMEDEFHEVYPQEASREAFLILNLLQEICGKTE